MFAPRIRGALLAFAAAAAVACRGSTEPGGGNLTPSAVSIASGNGQVGLVGQTLAVPLVVKVSANGTAVRGVTVNFAVTSGAASVSPATATTDSAGQAKTQVTLGSAPGTVTITATVAGTGLQTNFVVTAGSATTTLACASSSPTTPAAGGVLPGVTGTGICLGGSTTGAEYALVVFHGNPDSSSVASFTVSGRGAAAVSTPSIVPSFETAAAPPVFQTEPSNRRAEFDAHLRETSRRELTPLFASARLRARQGAAFTAIPANPAIGTTFTLNANGEQPCTNVKNRTGRVAAVSSGAIVIADTENPTGGFTDAEYLSFATMFDTLIAPLDISNFGTNSDVDRNGKIVMFFTKEVNALTPKGSTGGTIGGFFYERDLFPVTTSGGLQGCAGSNFAEMFYVLVPDPQGLFGRVQQKSNVLDVTPGTIAHEYQHLINAGRRLYVNDANDFEDTWLNEGLSHTAEELLYYNVSRLAPRQNLGITEIRANSVALFNTYQIDNNGRYELFMAKPAQTSVYGDADNLETRGATWNMLRYLADHRGTGDGDVWQQLVNTKLTGQTNLAHVFGTNYLTQIRDWATSVFSDDVAGVTDTRFLQTSWNMRSIFPALVNSNGTPLGRFPLSVVPLSDASPALLSVIAGGVAYVRFSVAAGSQASIDWSAGGLPVSGLVQFTVARTK